MGIMGIKGSDDRMRMLKRSVMLMERWLSWLHVLTERRSSCMMGIGLDDYRMMRLSRSVVPMERYPS